MQKSVENSRASATLGQITLFLRQRRQISFVKEGHPGGPVISESTLPLQRLQVPFLVREN